MPKASSPKENTILNTGSKYQISLLLAYATSLIIIVIANSALKIEFNAVNKAYIKYSMHNIK